MFGRVASHGISLLSHDIRDIFRTLRAGRFNHAPLIKNVDWNEAWAAVESMNNFTRQGHNVLASYVKTA